MSDTQQNYISWESEHDHRGTFNIIATCFSTLVICLWSALHLSIPRKKRSWKKDLGVKLAWMAIGLFLPELLILVAVGQRRLAAQLRDKVNSHFKLLETRRPWYQHWFWWTSTAADEGDEEKTLVDPSESIESKSACPSCTAQKHKSSTLKPVLTLPVQKDQPKRHRWTLIHGFYVLMGGYATYGSNGDLRILDSDFIEYALMHSPELIPDLSEDTILDKSKADDLAKAILATQVGWFCISCLNRLAQNYPLTLLEISTLAHALCSMMVYIVWWDKPLNIQEPLVISGSSLLETQEIFRNGNWFEIEETDGLNAVGAYVIVFSTSLIYGAPHLLAWNSAFVTRMEQMLWRIASCVVAGPGVYFLALDRILYLIRCCIAWEVGNTLSPILICLSSLAYFPATLYLMAESLRQLFHLPPSAFQTPAWSNYFPHFS